MRKVFISFLGTNNYLETHYVLNGLKSPVVRFVQQALIGFLCKDWTENDRVMIFYTKASHDKNWVDGGQGERVSAVENIGLFSVLQSMQQSVDNPLHAKVEGYEIAEGFSEEEIWSIFDCVYEKLQEGDCIYFDVTHAFRSIPLFSTVLFNYARFMKGIKLVSVHYGAFEKLGSAFWVKTNIPDPDKREAPIVDLTSLVDLQNTNVAANNFIEFGKVGTIASQLSVEGISETKEQRKSYVAIKSLKTELGKLDDYIQTCRMDKIKQGQYIKNILSQFDVAVKSRQLQCAEKLLLIKIKDHLSDFKGENTDDNIEAAVKWAFRYGMLQQAYTLGQEFIITKTCDLLKNLWICGDLENENPFGKNKRENKRYRFYVSGVLGISDDDRKGYKDDLALYSCLTDELLSLSWLQELRKWYNILRINRNALNHAKGSVKKSDEMREEFGYAYEACMEILNREKNM